MYIIAIAWIYVAFMMAITEQSVVAALMTFILYGVFPLTIVLYLMGTPQRKRNRQEKLKQLSDRQDPPSTEAATPEQSPIAPDK